MYSRWVWHVTCRNTTIDPDAGGMQVAERLWPLVREMSMSLLDQRADYVMEGEILPKHVGALRHAHSAQIKACFLGYSTIAPAQKLREIRTHAGYPNDWPQSYADADLLTIIAREIAFSQYLQAECARYGFRYFDTSHQFMLTLDEVVGLALDSGEAQRVDAACVSVSSVQGTDRHTHTATAFISDGRNAQDMRRTHGRGSRARADRHPKRHAAFREIEHRRRDPGHV